MLFVQMELFNYIQVNVMGIARYHHLLVVARFYAKPVFAVTIVQCVRALQCVEITSKLLFLVCKIMIMIYPDVPSLLSFTFTPNEMEYSCLAHVI